MRALMSSLDNPDFSDTSPCALYFPSPPILRACLSSSRAHMVFWRSGHHVGAVYMAFQPDVTVQMRSILIDWLVEVANGEDC